MATIEYAALVVSVNRDRNGVEGKYPFSASLLKANIKDINRPTVLTWAYLACGGCGQTPEEAADGMPDSWRGIPRIDTVNGGDSVDADAYNLAAMAKVEQHITNMLTLLNDGVGKPETFPVDPNAPALNPIDPHDTL